MLHTHRTVVLQACVLGGIVLIHASVAGAERQILSVADYGAKKEGSAFATDAFRQAIRAAKSAGGGTIYVPPGTYRSGPIELFSNMTLDVVAVEDATAPGCGPLSAGRGGDSPAACGGEEEEERACEEHLPWQCSLPSDSSVH